MQLVAEIFTVMGCVLAVVAVVSALIGVGLTAIGWFALWCVGKLGDQIGGHE